MVDKYAKEIVGRLGNNLEALILVGSYSRGEAIEGISDLEYWAVVKDLAKAKKPELDANVSLGFTTREHLKQLKPYIYTVEVKKFGKVVYGDKDILNLIPDYSYGDIDPFDGFILLNNRIVEQLVLLNGIENKHAINKYDFNKSYIQLVNSLLVFNKKYRGLYPEKLEEFRKISKDIDAGLVNRVEDAFVSIKHTSGVALSEYEAFKKWLEVRGYFRAVWNFEVNKLGGIWCWFKMLCSGRPMRYFVYRKAVKLYFSNNCHDKRLRSRIIEQWSRFVK